MVSCTFNSEYFPMLLQSLEIEVLSNSIKAKKKREKSRKNLESDQIFQEYIDAKVKLRSSIDSLNWEKIDVMRKLI